jgi:hypothetical protein
MENAMLPSAICHFLFSIFTTFPLQRFQMWQEAFAIRATLSNDVQAAYLGSGTMTTGYTTVFQVSYLSNGLALFSAAALLGSLFFAAVATMVYRRLSPPEAEASRQKFMYFRLIPVGCAALAAVWLASNIYDASKFTSALRDGRCAIVEGQVHVIRQEPFDGRGGGVIQIADKTFHIATHQDKLSYRGGQLLVDGITARVHYLGNDMLKVEIKD